MPSPLRRHPVAFILLLFSLFDLFVIRRPTFILEQAGAVELANVVEKHLGGRSHRIALDPGYPSSPGAVSHYSERWKVMANTSMEI